MSLVKRHHSCLRDIFAGPVSGTNQELMQEKEQPCFCGGEPTSGGSHTPSLLSCPAIVEFKLRHLHSTNTTPNPSTCLVRHLVTEEVSVQVVSVQGNEFVGQSTVNNKRK